MKKGKAKLFIVIPAYNEERTLGKVIDDLKIEGYNNIVVVDDGSKDRTSDIADKKGVYLFRHMINRGLGGALGTGLDAAYHLGADIAVTFDADGQHFVGDIKNMVAPILKGKADVVIGSRMINPKGMTLVRRIGNWGLNFVTYLLFGFWTTDSQSGMRAFDRKSLYKIETKTSRMEVSSEFFKEFRRHRLRLAEVPIKVIYTEYSMAKGQSSWNAFKIVTKLVIRKIMR
ncbi:glycosyltransferase family 2 protein [Candidatus Woesearchaeota archaeon]|nr:glycosyltransferase family 2 protein [Candidatus Woesearchaeota archaeon]